ncbi:MAG TPA: hypothetical protein VGF76_24585, partial [Polyangiaceae bacterium]
MKHVYVETNFIIELLRPFAAKGATDLRARHGQDLVLHVPWCSTTEAKRTLDRIVNEDLGFVDNAGRFLAKLGAAAGRPDRTMQQETTKFVKLAREARRDGLYNYLERLESFAKSIDVIAPSPLATERTVEVFRRKLLNPFDEMVLGLVLAEAEQRRARFLAQFSCPLAIRWWHCGACLTSVSAVRVDARCKSVHRTLTVRIPLQSINSSHARSAERHMRECISHGSGQVRERRGTGQARRDGRDRVRCLRGGWSLYGRCGDVRSVYWSRCGHGWLWRGRGFRGLRFAFPRSAPGYVER